MLSKLGLAVLVALLQTAELRPLQFLIGNWRAVDTAAGESGSFSFRLESLGHVMVRRNEASYAATKEKPASRHEDVMTIFSEHGSLRAEYFDSEDHVIRYAVRPASQSVVFVSDVVAREPRYRLTYHLADDGLLLGSFEIAAPDAPESFRPYLSWKAKRY